MKRFKAFTSSVIGREHVRSGKVCQDSVGSYEDDDMVIAVVSDGHGSPQYFRSDRGSAFAVEVSLRCVREFISSFDLHGSCDSSLLPLSELDDPDSAEQYLHRLEESILVEWSNMVEEDRYKDPFTEEDLAPLSQKYRTRYRGDLYPHAYGATLIITAATERFWFVIQMGDGYAVKTGRDGSTDVALELDPLCQFNISTSLCLEDAMEHFCHVFSTELPAALFAASDGVDDSYVSRELLTDLYESIVIGFGNGFEAGKKKVEDFLPVITRDGKGDDTSMVGIIDVSVIEKIAGECREKRRKRKDAAHISQTSDEPWDGLSEPQGDAADLSEDMPEPGQIQDGSEDTGDGSAAQNEDTAAETAAEPIAEEGDNA